MNKSFQPWEFLVVSLAGRVNRDQQKVIHHLLEESLADGGLC